MCIPSTSKSGSPFCSGDWIYRVMAIAGCHSALPPNSREEPAAISWGWGGQDQAGRGWSRPLLIQATQPPLRRLGLINTHPLVRSVDSRTWVRFREAQQPGCGPDGGLRWCWVICGRVVDISLFISSYQLFLVFHPNHFFQYPAWFFSYYCFWCLLGIILFTLHARVL